MKTLTTLLGWICACLLLGGCASRPPALPFTASWYLVEFNEESSSSSTAPTVPAGLYLVLLNQSTSTVEVEGIHLNPVDNKAATGWPVKLPLTPKPLWPGRVQVAAIKEPGEGSATPPAGSHPGWSKCDLPVTVVVQWKRAGDSVQQQPASLRPLGVLPSSIPERWSECGIAGK